MPTITIKDIPESLYNRFKDVAQRDRRSINAEVIVAMDLLIKGFEQQAQEEALIAERIASIQRVSEHRGQRQFGAVDTLALLREDRDR